MEHVEKLLPQNVEAEMAVLGAILIDAGTLAEVVPILRPDDFYREAHRLIYGAMCDLWYAKRPADYISVCDELERRGKLADVGGSSYISSLSLQTPTYRHATYYAGIVGNKATMRRLIDAAGQIAGIAYNEPDADEAIATAEIIFKTALLSRAASQDIDGVDIGDAIDAFIAECDEAVQGGTPLGIKTGFRDLDGHMMGLRPGDLVDICGRPGSFKSTIAAGIAEHVARQYGCVEWLSLEMTDVQQVKRLVSSWAEVDGRMIRAGFRDPESGVLDMAAYEATRTAAERNKAQLAGRIKFHAKSLTLSQLVQRATHAVHTRNSKLLIVDYIGLVQSDDPKRRQSENERVTHISQQLKQLALELRIPIICLVQMNREAEKRSEHRPRLSDLRDSGALEQDADFVVGIYRGASYNAQQAKVDPRYRQFVELIMLKARDGVAENVTIPLRVEGEYTRPSNWPDEWPYKVYLTVKPSDSEE